MRIIRTSKTHQLVFWIGWAFFTLVLTALLHSSNGMTLWNALLLSMQLSGIAQVSAWSAIFSCKTAPLNRTPLWRLLVTHVATALLLTFFWVRIGKAIVNGFATMPSWEGSAGIYAQKMTLLYASGAFYYLLSVAFNYALIAQAASVDAQQRVMESSIRARDAELSALKAQINPHFLYNSLNSISALTSIDPARAREMCVLLADFLRMTLGLGEKPLIPLKEELELLDRYCAIERVRFGDRLRVEKTVQDDSKACLLPPLLLQPLFENAVVHGIAQLPEGGSIRLNVSCLHNRINFSVENSWDPEAVSARKKNGVGLRNVQRRLEARYGKEAHIDVQTEEHLFRVSASFPAETQEAQ
jgi:two-component system, LytTR family, sensor histidine kinase AlgZ